jgi:hypothetical protein
MCGTISKKYTWIRFGPKFIFGVVSKKWKTPAAKNLQGSISRMNPIKLEKRSFMLRNVDGSLLIRYTAAIKASTHKFLGNWA